MKLPDSLPVFDEFFETGDERRLMSSWGFEHNSPFAS